MFRKKAEIRPQNLFFIELIISLLFFSLSSAVIVQVFAAAHNKQQKSALVERAVMCGQSLAEAYSVSGSVEFAVQQVFGEVTLADGSLLLDDEFNVAENGVVGLTLTEERVISAAGTLKLLDLSFSADETEFFSLRSAAYRPNEGGAAYE